MRPVNLSAIFVEITKGDFQPLAVHNSHFKQAKNTAKAP
jgi:hypothetical protein